MRRRTKWVRVNLHKIWCPKDRGLYYKHVHISAHYFGEADSLDLCELLCKITKAILNGLFWLVTTPQITLTGGERTNKCKHNISPLIKALDAIA